MNAEQLGNYAYGYLGKATGLGEETLYWAADWSQQGGEKKTMIDESLTIIVNEL